jgi:hypothetical protein
MKTLATLAIFTISGLFSMQICQSQDLNDRSYAVNLNTAKAENNYNTSSDNEIKPTLNKDDVVINMEMIESFRRCYDKIQPFSFSDFFRGDPSEISIKYMAFMRIRAKNVTENLDQAINAEIEIIKSELNNKPKFNTMVAYSEDKVTEQSKQVVQEQPSSDTKDQNLNPGKGSSSTVKWVHKKS